MLQWLLSNVFEGRFESLLWKLSILNKILSEKLIRQDATKTFVHSEVFLHFIIKQLK